MSCRPRRRSTTPDVRKLACKVAWDWGPILIAAGSGAPVALRATAGDVITSAEVVATEAQATLDLADVRRWWPIGLNGTSEVWLTAIGSLPGPCCAPPTTSRSSSTVVEGSPERARCRRARADASAGLALRLGYASSAGRASCGASAGASGNWGSNVAWTAW